MYIRAFDYLSPNITLYYKGELRHKSIVSGILTIIAYGVVLAVAIVFILQLFDKTSPTAFYSNRFIADVGRVPMDSKTLFHYYEILDFGSIPTKEYLKYFRIKAKTNVDGPDYWIYDYCNEEDYGDMLKEESYAEDIPVIKEKLCIRYYWNDTSKTFIRNDDPSFTYPTILHGISHPDYNYYQSSIEMCQNGTEQDQIFPKCEPFEKIIPFSAFHVLGLVLVDHDIDVDNYDNPIKAIKYKMWSARYMGNYLLNNLNYDPVLLKTHKGLIFDKIKEENTFVYAQDGRTNTVDDIGIIFHQFNLYIMNRQLVYDRSYKKLPEVLANVGGMTQVIVNVAFVINLLINRFCLFLDCEVEIMNYKTEENKRIHVKIKDTFKQEKGNQNILKEMPIKIYSQKERKEKNEDESSYYNLRNKENNLIPQKSSHMVYDKPNETEGQPRKTFFKPKTAFVQRKDSMTYFNKVNFINFIGYLISRPFKTKLNKKQSYIEFVENMIELTVSEETMFDVHYFLEYYVKSMGDNSKENSFVLNKNN